MLRKLLIILCVAMSTKSVAQVGITPVKTTEKHAETEIDYKLPGSPMPSFMMVEMMEVPAKPAAGGAAESKKERREKAGTSNIAERVLTTGDLDNGANLFVLLFNPTCSHCEDETKMLGQHIELFKRSKIVLMANLAMKTYVPDFVKNLHTADFPPMHVGVDSAGFIDKVFMYQALPQINIYDGQRKLLKIYTGEANLDSLKQYIQ